MATLYELADNFKAVLDMEVASEEDAKAMETLLDEAAVDVEVKVLNIGYIINRMLAEEKVLESRIGDADRRARVHRNKMERLGQYAEFHMKQTQIDKVDAVDMHIELDDTAWMGVVVSAPPVPVYEFDAESPEFKVGQMGLAYNELKAQIAAVKAHEGDLRALRKGLEIEQDRIEEAALLEMTSNNLTKVELPDITVRTQANPPALKILDEDAIPEEFWVVQAPTLDKPALKKWLKDHPDCDFAWLEQGTGIRFV